MDPVSQEVVVRHWLKQAPERPGDVEPSSLDKVEAYTALTRAYPAETAVLWQDRPVDWYRTSLSLGSFKRLHLSLSPGNDRLRELSGDGTVWECANAIYDGRPGRVDEPADRPIDRILELATEYPFDGNETLVVTTRRGCAPDRGVMGADRAVAIALAVRYGKTYDPLVAYVGVEGNPVLSPIWERTCGAARGIATELGIRDLATDLGDRLAALRDR